MSALTRYASANVNCPWRTIQPPPTGGTSAAERIAYGYLYPITTVVTAEIVRVKNEAITIGYATSTSRLPYATATATVPYSTGEGLC